jgi:hypothetical protein
VPAVVPSIGQSSALLGGSSYALVVPRLPLGVAAVLAAALVVAACSSGQPAPSFDPSGACTVDGRLPGAYPDLEARVPVALDGRAPAKLDSGRNCTPANLATLANHGLGEVRFAGASWSDGGARGRTLAVFSAPGLEPEWIAEWYLATAERGRRTEDIETFPVTVDGRPGTRIQLVNDDRHQVVVVWPSGDGAVTQVVIASDVPNAMIDAAIAAFP